MADYGGSTTNPETRDRTRTPKWLFDALNSVYHFQLDVACLPETALCERYLTPTIDALSVNWGDFLPSLKRAPWVWLNPPYSNIGPWVEKARIEQRNGIGTVMLVPLDKSAKWYANNGASEVCELVGGRHHGKWVPGRVNFVDAETGEEIKGNPKGSMLLMFAPGWPHSQQMKTEQDITVLMRAGGRL